MLTDQLVEVVAEERSLGEARQRIVVGQELRGVGMLLGPYPETERRRHVLQQRQLLVMYALRARRHQGERTDARSLDRQRQRHHPAHSATQQILPAQHSRLGMAQVTAQNELARANRSAGHARIRLGAVPNGEHFGLRRHPAASAILRARLPAVGIHHADGSAVVGSKLRRHATSLLQQLIGIAYPQHGAADGALHLQDPREMRRPGLLQPPLRHVACNRDEKRLRLVDVAEADLHGKRRAILAPIVASYDV